MRQADFVIRECETCHVEFMDGERRRRCRTCKRLLCGGCYHVHSPLGHSTCKAWKQGDD